MTSQKPMLLVLVLSFVAILFSAKLSIAMFLSIDCGASQTHTDKNSIKWVGDEDYVTNGASHSLESVFEDEAMNTLRAFPTLEENCYTINVKEGDKILVRASFLYGNYDGKYSPPTFGLHLEGNFWTNVNMSKYSTYHVSNFEAIYTTKKKTTSICLSQIMPNQVPFISALEFRSLDSNMYSHVSPNNVLFNVPTNSFVAHVQRYAVGEHIRYPSDLYDRIWYNLTSDFLGYLEVVGNEASSIDVSSVEDKPPAAAFQNALVSKGSIGFMEISIRLSVDLPDYKVPIYFVAYFSEVASLSTTEKRSFQFYVDDMPYSQPIVPPFGSVKQVYITNITANSNTSFTLRRTLDSTLPPLINAYEIYTLRDPLTRDDNSPPLPKSNKSAPPPLETWKPPSGPTSSSNSENSPPPPPPYSEENDGPGGSETPLFSASVKSQELSMTLGCFLHVLLLCLSLRIYY